MGCPEQIKLVSPLNREPSKHNSISHFCVTVDNKTCNASLNFLNFTSSYCGSGYNTRFCVFSWFQIYSCRSRMPLHFIWWSPRQDRRLGTNFYLFTVFIIIFSFSTLITGLWLLFPVQRIMHNDGCNDQSFV